MSKQLTLSSILAVVAMAALALTTSFQLAQASHSVSGDVVLAEKALPAQG